MTLMVFFILLSLHTLMVALVKLCTSEEFRSRDGSRFQKVIHVISNINIPTPFRDWDVGDFSVEEHKKRHWRTEREMGCLFIVNTVFSLALLGPLWYLASNDVIFRSPIGYPSSRKPKKRTR